MLFNHNNIIFRCNRFSCLFKLYGFHYTVIAYNKVSPPKVKVSKGGYANFNCHTIDDVKWRYFGSALPLNSLTGKSVVDQLYWLKIVNVEASNEGVYVCLNAVTLERLGDGILEIEGKCCTRLMITLHSKEIMPLPIVVPMILFLNLA